MKIQSAASNRQTKILINKNITEYINKKLLGKDIANFYCMDCLADFLGCTVDDLLDKIEEFKDEGCTLFK